MKPKVHWGSVVTSHRARNFEQPMLRESAVGRSAFLFSFIQRQHSKAKLPIVECLRVVRQTSPESCQCLFAPAMDREVSSSPRHVSHSCFRPRDLTSPPVLGMRRAQVFRLTYSKVFELFIAGMTRIAVAQKYFTTTSTCGAQLSGAVRANASPDVNQFPGWGRRVSKTSQLYIARHPGLAKSLQLRR